MILRWLVPPPVSLQERVTEWGWTMHPMWMMWGVGGFVMMLMMVLFWAVVIVGVIVLVRWLLRQPGAARHDPALSILRERYARGEINKEEFDARRRDLQ